MKAISRNTLNNENMKIATFRVLYVKYLTVLIHVY